jgi:HlyD family secretion protein
LDAACAAHALTTINARVGRSAAFDMSQGASGVRPQYWFHTRFQPSRKQAMTIFPKGIDVKSTKKWWWAGIATVAVMVAAALAWKSLQPSEPAAAFVSGNGRIEAVVVDVATKLPGRIAEMLVDEGDFLKAGDEVASMDTHALQAQMAQARAQVRQAENAQATALAVVAQRQSERASAVAVQVQRAAERDLAAKRLQRSRELSVQRAISQQALDEDEAKLLTSSAAVDAARAQIAATEAGIRAAQSQVIEAASAIDAATATLAQLQADLDDSVLRAPRAGRVEYRIAQPGEVLASGGKLLSIVDLGEVYMNFFLPETVAGRVALGSEVRLVLDAAPDFIIPARVSYVASVAQFTPKTVETLSERQKLMFRVKARIDRKLLEQHIAQVKTGLPGVAHVRLDATAPWPAALALKQPPTRP